MEHIFGILIFLIVLLVSIIIHELSHGYAALKNGDPTPKYTGRLTLNPVAHFDLIGSFVLPFLLLLLRSPILIGKAKPVPINPYYFRNYKKGMITVALAGPLSNIMIGFLFSFLYKLFYLFSFSDIFKYISQINFMLAFFNLIPIPPLDGSRILTVLLPYNIGLRFEEIERYGILIIFLLAFSGGLNWIFPLTQKLINLIVNL